MRKPWWRKTNQMWYVTAFGQQHRLSEEPDPDGGTRKHPPPDVERAWHRLVSGSIPAEKAAELTVKEVFDPFRELCRHEPKKCTDWILGRFQEFVGPGIPVMNLRPYHLTNFFKKNPQWAPSTQRTVTNRVLAAINHAVREGHLEKNPISSTPGYRRHGYHTRREEVFDPGLREKLEGEAGPALRSVLVALRETGCRPSEIRRARVERCFLDKGVLYVPNKTARKTGKGERRVYLSEELKRLLAGLVGGRKEGHIFFTAKGKPWSYSNLEVQWQRLVKKVPAPKGITLYSYRRAFASAAINEKNVNPALVAQLMGHADLNMLLRHYVREDPEALKKAIDDITREGGGATPPRGGTP